MRIHPSIFDKIKNKKKDRDSENARIPLYINPPPSLDDIHEDIESHKKKKKKSSNDCVININEEFIVDFNIEEGTVVREGTWKLNVK